MTLISILNLNEPIQCVQPSLKTLLHFLPIFLQCSFLHPSFSNSLTISNTRILLTPLNVYLSLRLSIDFCFKPFEKTGMGNFVLGILGFYLALKSLEWGLLGGYWEGKYWNKPEKVEDDVSDPTKSENQKEKEMEMDDTRSGWLDIIGWTIMQSFSIRGLQYGWGPRKKLEAPKFKPILIRLILLNFLQAITLGILIILKNSIKSSTSSSSSSSTSTSINLFNLIGIPTETLFTKTLYEMFCTFIFGTWFATTLDVSWSTFTLLCLSLHHLHQKSYLTLPTSILTFFDPKLCTPLFGRPLEANSLESFWGKAWHQLLRRSALVCAGIPMGKLMAKIGAGKSLQRFMGLFASFFLVGVLHEFAIHSVARSPHPSPHLYFQEFPSALFYFSIQPIGILLERFLIPYIPTWLGGGRLWVLSFSLLVGTPYRIQYIDKLRLIDEVYQDPDQWTFWSFCLPAGMIKLKETAYYLFFKTSDCV